MNSDIKLPANKAYFLSIFSLTIGLFLFATGFLMFGKPTPEDLPPMISFDILYLLVIISLRKYILYGPNELTALELNKNEIIDHISGISIKWDNVSDIRFVKTGYGNYIFVYVNDKKTLNCQTKNIFKKINFYINTIITGAPVRIVPLFIKGKNSVIFEKINEYFNEINLKPNIG